MNTFLSYLVFQIFVHGCCNHAAMKYNKTQDRFTIDQDKHNHLTSKVSKNFDKPSQVGFLRRYNRRREMSNSVSLWIDEQQVKAFSGYLMEVFVILNGYVMPYILEPSFEKALPIIPYGMEQVNFTWRSGKDNFYYEFYNFASNNTSLISTPTLSIRRKGKVPRKKKKFSIFVNCTGRATGIAQFEIGFKMMNKKMENLPGTPFIIKLQKECLISGFDKACDKNCSNGGICDSDKICRCPEGYIGAYCQNALCFPQCRNGGTCTAPGLCSCPLGFHGGYCEGGICRQQCLHGGKCTQKDTCSCRKGFYGNQCEFSKCIIPCINGGKCKGINKCRCLKGFSGDHCQIISSRKLHKAIRRCKKKCRHGRCGKHGKCKCKKKYIGRWCRKKYLRKKKRTPKLWARYLIHKAYDKSYNDWDTKASEPWKKDCRLLQNRRGKSPWMHRKVRVKSQSIQE